MLISSIEQTKQWRTSQEWYKNGKSNECENYQIRCIEQITGLQLIKQKGIRLNMFTFDLKSKKNPLKDVDGYEWTEDFDGLFEHQSITFYINLKFVCDQGGAQTRTLREVYHFIATQLQHVKKNPDKNIYFINILDGNESFRNMSKFKYLLKSFIYDKVDKVFVGDMKQFEEFWKQKQVNKKQELGQFFTTNYIKILTNLNIPKNVKHVIEPFAGAGDLRPFINNPDMIIECYDIDPKNKDIIQRDTLQDPPCYYDKFVLTNPPYLARNKSKDKKYFDQYKVDDLYKCFIKQLIGSNAYGGIIIIPVNFWCSVRKTDLQLRKEFIEKYEIIHLNIFDEPVFSDTSYSVCSFQFEKRKTINTPINISVYPELQEFSVNLSNTNHYLIGGDIYNLKRTHYYNISRLTKNNKDKKNTNILLKCIDDEQPIGLTIVKDEKLYVDDTPNTSARSYATLLIEPPISKIEQENLVENFNNLLDKYRKNYHSLFLSNYRENKRKRISFELAYHIVGHLLEHIN